ncbi:MAG TPA: NUDIX domain-containing protein [Thermoanaerobaculia bacterium]|nr:NUDIX domain-containing protein [Thermoanaerobaculia bacterium]
MRATVDLDLSAVILAVTEEVPRILTVRRKGGGAAAVQREEGLPFGSLDPAVDRTLERGLRRWVREQTGLELGYVEQLYSFGDRNRDPREARGGPRLVSVAYLALVREREVAGSAEARWRDWYEFFPWEDWRSGRPTVIDRIAPAFDRWVAAAPGPVAAGVRRERADIAFGLRGVGWDGERVLERYELLYEAGLVQEAHDDGTLPWAPFEAVLHEAEPMAGDHRRILATAIARLRAKIKYRPLVFELLPPTFTFLQLQQTVEGLAGLRLHKPNFRRLVEQQGLVEDTGQTAQGTGGRPARLLRFRSGPSGV